MSPEAGPLAMGRRRRLELRRVTPYGRCNGLLSVGLHLSKIALPTSLLKCLIPPLPGNRKHPPLQPGFSPGSLNTDPLL